MVLAQVLGELFVACLSGEPRLHLFTSGRLCDDPGRLACAGAIVCELREAAHAEGSHGGRLAVFHQQGTSPRATAPALSLKTIDAVAYPPLYCCTVNLKGRALRCLPSQ